METGARKIVTKIEANPLLVKNKSAISILRVAAYCRVSTDSDDQIESYKAQVSHYTDLILKNPKWRFVRVYADEGITGTLAKKRDDFMRMIRDCRKGKIDMILTKSFTRFARNTVDSLKYIRELKALGIGIFFEEQNLNTLTVDSEMFVGLYSVMAQAESENISANVRWGIRQRMKSGTFPFRYNIMGYRKGANGEPEIVPEEAETVRTIFQLYLNGWSIKQICKYLEEQKIPTKTGKNHWGESVVQSMLRNERFCGNMMQQKTYTEDCINKRVRVNRGEQDKYFIPNNHVPIISEAEFNRVQKEIARRVSLRKTSEKSITDNGKYSGKYALTELLICGECGSPFKRVTWRLQGQNKKVWRCKNRVENGTKYCKESGTLDEEKLHTAICRGLNKATENREEVRQLIETNLAYAATECQELLDVYAIEHELKNVGKQINDNVKLLNSTKGNKDRVIENIKILNEKSAVLREQLQNAREKVAVQPNIREGIEEIQKMLENEEMRFSEYDETIARRLIELIRVEAVNKIVIYLKGGMSVEEYVG